jgi:pimeloyl-ACP methyl ester carboxylesterase
VRARKFLLAAAAAALLAACGGSGTPNPRPAPNNADTTQWQVDGQTIHLDCAGRGSPTVLLLAGSGDPSTVWDNLRPQIKSRTCAFDYPGVGESTSAGGRMTTRRAVDALEGVLDEARVAGPLVVVGHSMAGLTARLFVKERASQVRAAVLFDPTTAEFVLGPARGAIRDQSTWDPVRSGQQALSVKRWPNIPVIVLAHDPTVTADDAFWTPVRERVWQRSQRALADLSARGRYRVVDGASHFIYRDDPATAITAINSVLSKSK